MFFPDEVPDLTRCQVLEAFDTQCKRQADFILLFPGGTTSSCRFHFQHQIADALGSGGGSVPHFREINPQ